MCTYDKNPTERSEQFSEHGSDHRIELQVLSTHYARLRNILTKIDQRPTIQKPFIDFTITNTSYADFTSPIGETTVAMGFAHYWPPSNDRRCVPSS